ncbi:glutamine-dependent NAD(+) synthetase [Coemansia sp. RSA 1722]|nr:glutamine-dependent NAD(+) synthetase [Coemansia sp. RSA 486]KAJ2236215.1 glutamine-dependent NAD(+) synthetase [Coemansia sp. RSA 485]KAJ2598138.1 glutamine-dependent NAD(+) synthetase [Coemansia sp. RSA 1722]KAJ2602713.1 glutamine-dependent NAD(+) synthetase [Coemansia sp. RSA 1721]KAJ2640235.1 glutamine-dependent NAD(+) synthetase [Coemansia sp. RSA 1286]
MVHYVTVATCALNQWALDFQGNKDRIVQSILEAKSQGARLRIGPELEIPGYGCYDHFLESDTMHHSWQVLCDLLQDSQLHDILIDTGMPILHRNVRYNCRVIVFNGRIALIRPKMYLANDGNYRETRWFSPWTKKGKMEEFVLPPLVAQATGQRTAPFGDALIGTLDSCIGIELCEELFTPASPHIEMSLAGAEIIINSSGSHHELRKLRRRVDLIAEATLKCGGIYLYANQRGCDGDRLYYDGAAMILANGLVVAMGRQFGLSDVEVTVATVDLGAVRAFRAANSSRSLQAAQSSVPEYPRVTVEFALAEDFGQLHSGAKPTKPLQCIGYLKPEEEICLGPACWLWDYLRRSRMGGYFLPLSGGIDSCSTALIVFSMCSLVVEACRQGDSQVVSDVRRVCGLQPTDALPATAQELAGILFHTCYMGTENSSKETRQRALQLAQSIGSYHVDLAMDQVVTAIVALFTLVTGGPAPRYSVHGGSNAENLALQNIQARLRMLLAYLFAALLPWVRHKNASLLVLGSANVDEALRGYFTKYDCSSADLNPIGSISKSDLRRFVAYARDHMHLFCLDAFLDAMPSAELVPASDGVVQSDEVEMGMTYDELGQFGRLRMVERCGPYSMFVKLLHQWDGQMDAEQVATKVKRFFRFYAINRHKMTTLTPAYHAENYAPDDNRFDMRPFLYDATWAWQFAAIDRAVEQMKKSE